jgi:hypothetical protein
MEQLTSAQKKDLKLLFNFIRLYCGAKHAFQVKVKVEAEKITGGETLLCLECAEIAKHALEKRCNCPLDPKPSCKRCRIHCYSKDFRARIREIMAFSGRRMILRGRLHYLKYYFF